MHSPLAFLNQQIGAHQGMELVAIRIHPADLDRFLDELEAAGFERRDVFGLGRVGGVPIFEDEECIDGPVAELRDPIDIEEAVRRLQGLLH